MSKPKRTPQVTVPQTKPLRAPDIEQVWLSKVEAAAYLRFGVDTIDNMIDLRLVPVYRPTITGTRSQKILFRRSDLDEWMAKFRVEASEQPPSSPPLTAPAHGVVAA